MGKIITGGEANDLAGRIVFSDASRCPTYNDLVTNGFIVDGTYATNQLVDAVNVSAGGGSAGFPFTIYYWWTGNTQSFTNGVSNVFSWRYYVEFYADNRDYASLSNDEPLVIVPNELQNTGSGEGEYKCMINNDTQSIIVSFWCEYPRGFYGTENHWTTYRIPQVGNDNSGSRAGSFVNSTTIQIPISTWRFGGTDAIESPFKLNFTGCVSAQTYGSSFRQEINKILNEGE